METARRHLLISGRVQGVFYRAFARDVAIKCGINGWVRNLRDGRVEAVFEGNALLIEQAIAHCRKGPSGSRVADIELIENETPEGLQGFEIRY